MTAPAVFRFRRCVPIGIEIDRRQGVKPRLDVALIFIGQRAVVIFEVIEEMHRPVLRVAQHADPDLRVVDQDFEVGAQRGPVDVVVARHRDHRAVGKAAQIGRARADHLVTEHAEGL
ncbi:hypothetical protein D3C87_1848180 [compost metagenome]